MPTLPSPCAVDILCFQLWDVPFWRELVGPLPSHTPWGILVYVLFKYVDGRNHLNPLFLPLV